MAGDLVPWQDRVDCSRRYDADSGNVSQALGWCLASADTEAGLRLCTAVSPRWIVWGTCGEGSEWVSSFFALGTCDSFLHRDDFTRHITTAEHGQHGNDAMHAAIDWATASAALGNGALPCSAGNEGSSALQPALPPECQLTSAMLSPVSTTATSRS
jgi:hypothetical protein